MQIKNNHTTYADSSAAQAYGVYSIPASFFIDAEGNAIARASGAIDRDTLQKGIDMILPEAGINEEK